MSETPMIIDRDDNNGFGGGLGTGLIGGLLGGLVFGGGAWGNRGNGTGSFDAGMLSALSNQISHADDAATQATIANLQSAAGVTAAITQGTISNLQSSQTTNDKLCAINNNITQQGGATREMGLSLAMQLQNQHSDLKATIIDQGCQDRALMKEIQTQGIRDKLAEVQAENSALRTQINLSSQLTAQTQYLIEQLKTGSTESA